MGRKRKYNPILKETYEKVCPNFGKKGYDCKYSFPFKEIKATEKEIIFDWKKGLEGKQCLVYELCWKKTDEYNLKNK